MTVAVASRKLLFPNIAGSTGPFSFNFRILNRSGVPQIKLTKYSALGVPSLLNYPADYSFVFSQNGLNGGTITLAVAGVTGESLLVNGATPMDQPTRYSNQGKFFPEKHEASYDQSTLIQQEQVADVARAAKIPLADTTGTNVEYPLAALRAGKVAAFDTLGNVAVSNLSLAQIEAISSAGINANLFYSATTGGTGDAVTAAAGTTLLIAGQEFRIVMGAANTVTAPTLNIDGRGAKTIKQQITTGKGPILPSAYIAGYTARFLYDGTDMILLNPLQVYGSAANIGTGSDFSGTDSINAYNQIDSYNPSSVVGAVVGAVTVPGISASTSGGTGAAPTRNVANDIIGGMTAYFYGGVAAAYQAGAAVIGRVVGAVANNLGTQLEFWTKVDNGNLTKAATIGSNQVLDLVVSPTLNGAPLTKQIQTVGGSVAANALTATLGPTTLDFRGALTSGTITTVTSSGTTSLVVPSTATLGTVNGVQSRLMLLAINNGGTIELAVVNVAGGNNLDETTLINTTAIAGGSNSANVIYSTTARTGVAFRVVGYIESTQSTAGTWATAPTTIQGQGGLALAGVSALGSGQTWQSVTRTNGTTYYNTTGRAIQVNSVVISNGSHQLTVNGTQVASCVDTTGIASNFFVVVPPGASYVVGGTGTVAIFELR